MGPLVLLTSVPQRVIVVDHCGLGLSPKYFWFSGSPVLRYPVLTESLTQPVRVPVSVLDVVIPVFVPRRQPQSFLVRTHCRHPSSTLTSRPELHLSFCPEVPGPYVSCDYIET